MTEEDRTRVRRIPEKQVDDRAVLDAILDAGRVGHLAVIDETEQPFVLPVAYARDGDRLLVHGSTASRLFRTLAAGATTCLTVTHLDGLVLARSAFESSMRYRSAMVFGSCDLVPRDEKLQALEVLTEHLLPQRWATLRAPLSKEIAATMILSLPILEWSVKVSDGWSDDPRRIWTRRSGQAYCRCAPSSTSHCRHRICAARRKFPVTSTVGTREKLSQQEFLAGRRCPRRR